MTLAPERYFARAAREAGAGAKIILFPEESTTIMDGAEEADYLRDVTGFASAHRCGYGIYFGCQNLLLSYSEAAGRSKGRAFWNERPAASEYESIGFSLFMHLRKALSADKNLLCSLVSMIEKIAISKRNPINI
jgi:hypothetical protein